MKKDSKAGKAPKQKKKMQLAKNKQELVMAIVVVSILVVKSVYDLSNYFYQQYQDNQMANAPVSAAVDQGELGALSDGSVNPQDPSIQTPSVNQAVAGADPMANSSVPENMQADANAIYGKTLEMQGRAPQGANPTSVAGMPQDMSGLSRSQIKRNTGKMKYITVVDSGRSNPFLPAAENFDASSAPKLPLLYPPESAYAGSEASKVMDTKISGILYDRYSPSAIINISGADYLVKKGDVINRYRVLSITKDQVIVQLGKNIYKAGVGQILEESKLNYNTIANLEKKFGGNEVSVGVRKRK